VILTGNKIFSLKIHCRCWAAKRLNHTRIIESLLYLVFCEHLGCLHIDAGCCVSTICSVRNCLPASFPISLAIDVQVSSQLPTDLHYKYFHEDGGTKELGHVSNASWIYIRKGIKVNYNCTVSWCHTCLALTISVVKECCVLIERAGCGIEANFPSITSIRMCWMWYWGEPKNISRRGKFL
jgi:hypothetical protein